MDQNDSNAQQHINTAVNKTAEIQKCWLFCLVLLPFPVNIKFIIVAVKILNPADNKNGKDRTTCRMFELQTDAQEALSLVA